MDDYYGLVTSEQLRHHDIDGFVESYLDERELADWPRVIEVVKWQRQKLGDVDFETPEELYSRLDEEYGDPDGSPSQPSRNVSALWEQFAAAVKDEYFVWTCEPADEVTSIDVKRWVQEKRPDWLDDADVRKRFAAVVF